MKRKWIQAVAVLLCLCFLCPAAFAAESFFAHDAEKSFCEQAGCKTGQLLAQKDWARAGVSGSDWMAFTFAINGVPEAYDVYLEELERFVTDAYEKHGCLDTVLATEYHRIALTVLALGGDPTSFGRDRDGKPVNLVADGVWNFGPDVQRQGLNGLVYSLIVLDAKDYDVPEGFEVDRQWLLDRIIASQNEDGGFGLVSGSSDADMTAMTLTALAPYKSTYNDRIENAVSYLAARQSEDGMISGFGERNSESVSQTVIALCTLGIDPELDSRFSGILGVLDSFRQENGTYGHTAGDGGDAMATEQALMALTALDRLRSGKAGIYRFTNYTLEIRNGGLAVKTVLIVAAGAVVLIAAATVIFAKRRKKHAVHNE